MKTVSGAAIGRRRKAVWVCANAKCMVWAHGEKPKVCVACKGDGFDYFDSQAEAKRWATLRVMERQGLINGLRRQQAFPLCVNGIRIGAYIADFSYYYEPLRTVIEDCKGVDTALSRWKRKHVAAQYGQEVRIVGGR